MLHQSVDYLDCMKIVKTSRNGLGYVLNPIKSKHQKRTTVNLINTADFLFTGKKIRCKVSTLKIIGGIEALKE